MIHYITHHHWASLVAGCITGAILFLLVYFHRPIVRLFRRALNKVFPSTTPSWKIVMSTSRPGGGRPRYFSLHTLATLTERNDLLKMAKEMKRSCEVNASFCNIVKAPVFYLHRTWDRNEKSAWKMLKKFIADYPYPEVRGFQHSSGVWSGGEYGKGTYTAPTHAMPEPFIKDDYSYANKIIKALRAHGRPVGIKEYYKIDKDQYVW